MKTIAYFFAAIGIILLLAVVSLVGRGCNHIGRSVDEAVIHYDEYYDIYHTCKKIDKDLLALKQTPSDDPMFAQFSKKQQIYTKREQLDRWIEEYNSKSKQIEKSVWKSSSLPYQLSTEDFPNY